MTERNKEEEMLLKSLKEEKRLRGAIVIIIAITMSVMILTSVKSTYPVVALLIVYAISTIVSITYGMYKVMLMTVEILEDK